MVRGAAISRPAFPLPATLLRAVYDSTIGQSHEWDTPTLKAWYLGTDPTAPMPAAELDKLNRTFSLGIEERTQRPSSWGAIFTNLRSKKVSSEELSVIAALVYRLQCTSGELHPVVSQSSRVSGVVGMLWEESVQKGGMSPARYLALWSCVEAMQASIRGTDSAVEVVPAINSVLAFGHLSFWPPAIECYEALGSTLRSAKNLRLVVQKLRLFKLFEGVDSSEVLRPLRHTPGGNFLICTATLFVDQRLKIGVLSATLDLMPMRDWLHEERRLLDVWHQVSSRVPRRGWSRRKIKLDSSLATPCDPDFRWYRLLRHHIAVDRAILRHYFRCSKGNLGRLNHDVISDVELFIYGRHTWPRWFLRDFHTPLKTEG